jgi:hypothetical protein
MSTKKLAQLVDVDGFLYWGDVPPTEKRIDDAWNGKWVILYRSNDVQTVSWPLKDGDASILWKALYDLRETGRIEGDIVLLPDGSKFSINDAAQADHEATVSTPDDADEVTAEDVELLEELADWEVQLYDDVNGTQVQKHLWLLDVVQFLEGAKLGLDDTSIIDADGKEVGQIFGPEHSLRVWLCSPFLLHMWQEHNNPNNTESHEYLSYQFWCDGKLIFQGNTYGWPRRGGKSIDGDFTLAGLLRHLAIKPGDTDREVFDSYTPEQLEFAEQHGEQLWQLADELENPRDDV